MKHIISILLAVALTSLWLSACSEPSEVVPVNDNTRSTSRTYKVADPTLLTPDEEDTVQTIRDEYYDHVSE